MSDNGSKERRFALSIEFDQTTNKAILTHEECCSRPDDTAMRFRLTMEPFYLERKMLLAEIAEYYNYHCCQQLRNGGINIKIFHEDFDKYVIKAEVDNYYHEISKQLNMPQYQ